MNDHQWLIFTQHMIDMENRALEIQSLLQRLVDIAERAFPNEDVKKQIERAQ